MGCGHWSAEQADGRRRCISGSSGYCESNHVSGGSICLRADHCRSTRSTTGGGFWPVSRIPVHPAPKCEESLFCKIGCLHDDTRSMLRSFRSWSISHVGRKTSCMFEIGLINKVWLDSSPISISGAVSTDQKGLIIQ
jgi:hypothetical protein